MLKLTLLGVPQIEQIDNDTSQVISSFRSKKALALLCYLVLTKQAHTRHHLAGLLWGEDGDEQAKNNLRVALNNLTTLFPNHIEADRLSVWFKADSKYWLDTELFVEGLTTIHSGSEPNTESLITLYRGELLDGLVVENAPSFGEWLEAQRAWWRRRAVELLEKIINARLADRHYIDAIPFLQRLLSLEPWREVAHRQLIEAYARLGNVDAAQAAYQACRDQLIEALGIDPMPETVALYEQVVAMTAQQFPTLPLNHEPFFGREVELSEVMNLLDNPQCTLITVTGFGGTGKTRLAMQTAQRLSQQQPRLFLNGVAFVALSGVQSGRQVPIALADVLGVSLSGRTSPMIEIANFLRNREMLLIFDNFEHLLSSPQSSQPSDEEAIELLIHLLERCPMIKIMVTSRESLTMAAEWRLELRGLDYTADQPHPQRQSAVQLFVASAQQAQASFELNHENLPLVLEVCRLVAGSPLALKLAALWLRVINLAEIVAQLERSIDLLHTTEFHAPPRQRSMRAIYDYTWSLLSPEERRVMATLSVFRGGCSEAAVAQVAGATPFLLAGLVDRGLLHFQVLTSGARYTIHELTRHYSGEQLSGEARLEAQRRYTAYFAQFAEQQSERQRNRQHQQAIEAVGNEIDNLQHVSNWLLQAISIFPEDQSVARWIIRMTPMMAHYCGERALLRAGFDAFNHARLAMEATHWAEANTADDQRPVAYLTVCTHLAKLAFDVGYYALVDQLLASVLADVERREMWENKVRMLTASARVHMRRGQYELALYQLDEAEQLCTNETASLLLADIYSVRGTVLNNLGHYSEAEHAHQQAAALFEVQHYVVGVVRSLGNLGGGYSRQLRFAEAKPLLERAHSMAQQNGLRWMLMFVGSNLGSALSGMGDHSQAETRYQESLRLAHEIGDQRWIAANLNGLARNALRRGEFTATEHYARQAMTVAHSIHSDADTLNSINFVGHVLAQRGQLEDGLKLLLFVQHHPSAMAWDREFSRPLLDELREELPATLFEESLQWRIGKEIETVVQMAQTL